MEGVLKIKGSVLKKCTDKRMTSVVIPDGVTEIGGYAFDKCESLSAVVIPSSVTEIGERAFAWCESLESVEIPSSVEEIGNCCVEIGRKSVCG